MKTLLLASLIITTIACTTPDYQELDTSLDKKGSSASGDIGITEDGKVVIQEQNSATEELRLQQVVNNDLESKLKMEASQLETCREYLADPRLGGNGAVVDIAEIDNLRSVNEVKEEFGIENGDLKFVRKERYGERLKSERKLESSLRKMLRLFTKQRKQCDQQVSVARVKAGLPAKKYKGEGYFNQNGTYVETRRHEQNLDDAFRIKAELDRKKP